MNYSDNKGSDYFNFVSSAGGTLYDPYKGDRAIAAAEKGQKEASAQLDTDTSEQFNMLRNAMNGRSLDQNLDTYNSAMGNQQALVDESTALSRGQQNVGSSGNVNKYLNPQMDMMLNNTMQRVQGGAGSALQSSAATKAASNAVSQQAGNLWQQAYQNAIGDASNNLNVANSMASTADLGSRFNQQNLTANNAPAEDYLQLSNDKAMQRYAGNIALAQANSANAAQDRSVLGNILG